MPPARRQTKRREEREKEIFVQGVQKSKIEFAFFASMAMLFFCYARVFVFVQSPHQKKFLIDVVRTFDYLTAREQLVVLKNVSSDTEQAV